MGRVVGIDYGLARLGIAISDEGKRIAFPSSVLPAKGGAAQTAKALAEMLKPHKPETIVIGLPLHLSGRHGFLADEVKHFVSLLEKEVNCPVVLWDERLTTAAAERSLREGSLTRKRRSKIIDSVTAVILLQNYLDALSIQIGG